MIVIYCTSGLGGLKTFGWYGMLLRNITMQRNYAVVQMNPIDKAVIQISPPPI